MSSLWRALTGYGSLGGANASSGVVVAQKEIKVERDSSRKVKQLNVEVGQEVKSGEVLFTYDMEDMQLTIDKAKLEIEQMKNNVKDLTTQISQLEKEKKSAPTSEQLSYTVQIQALEADKKEAEYNITVKQKELDAMTSGSGTANVTAPVDGKVQAINENGTDSSGQCRSLHHAGAGRRLPRQGQDQRAEPQRHRRRRSRCHPFPRG